LITILVTLLIIAASFTYIGQLNKAEIHLAPIIGFVLGALYSYSYIEEEEVTEYTLQCCIGILSITIIWDKSTDG